MPDLIAQLDERTIAIVVENRRHVPLLALAGLLDDVAKDFRRATGRELFVKELRQGSIIALLTDHAGTALAVIGGIVTIRDFARIVADVVSRALQSPQSTRAKAIGTVRSMAKVSLEGDGPVDLIAGGREPFRVRVSNPEARVIDRHTKRRIEPYVQHPIQPDGAVEEELRRFAEKKAVEEEGTPTFDTSGDPMLAVVRALILDLQSSAEGKHRLSSVIRNLRNSGKDKAAEIIQRMTGL